MVRGGPERSPSQVVPVEAMSGDSAAVERPTREMPLNEFMSLRDTSMGALIRGNLIVRLEEEGVLTRGAIHEIVEATIAEGQQWWLDARSDVLRDSYDHTALTVYSGEREEAAVSSEGVETEVTHDLQLPRTEEGENDQVLGYYGDSMFFTLRRHLPAEFTDEQCEEMVTEAFQRARDRLQGLPHASLPSQDEQSAQPDFDTNVVSE